MGPGAAAAEEDEEAAIQEVGGEEVEPQEVMVMEKAGSGEGAWDKHPEKRAKAAYLKFEEERMGELKEEYPTLKMSQLKEKLWKEVSRSIVLTKSIVEEESSKSAELAR